MFFEFIELDPFAAIRDNLFSDDEYLDFQMYLIENPEAGSVIPGTDGCRKIRWRHNVKGKRGGIRIIYFLRTVSGQIVLVYAYSKSAQVDVSRKFLRDLKGLCDD